MIEIVFGLFLAAIAAFFGAGYVPPGLPIQGFQSTISLVIGGAGLMLAGHGLFRHVRDGRDGETVWFRTLALMCVTLTALAALVLLTAGRMGAASLSGWPAGYLLVSYGVTIAMLYLFILFKRKQQRIESERSRSGLTGGSES